jgi:ribonuclease HI
MFDMNQVKLFTDGGSRGNPGPAAIGGVIYDLNGEKLKEFSEYIGESTNNIAEYSALIKGLRLCLEMGFKNVSCNLDSELVVKQLNKIYKVKDEKMKILYDVVVETKAEFESVSFTHVLRAKNKLADTLVNKALDGAKR